VSPVPQRPPLAALLPAALRTVRWRVVFVRTVVGMVLVAAIVFLLPPTYESTTTFVPVRETQGPMAAGLAGLGAAVGVELTSPDNPTQMFPEILRSRTLIEAVLTQPLTDSLSGQTGTYLDELRIRDSRPDRKLFLAVEQFRHRLRISIDARSNVVRVTLEGRTSWLVAAALNALIGQLQNYTVSMRSGVAQQNRLFAENEKAEARHRLSQAEAGLRAFRERNLRIGNSPQLLLEQERLMRDVKTEEEIFLTLVRQAVVNKLAEEKTTPMISVLDPARPTPFKARPRRLLLLMVGTAAVFVAAVGLSAWLDAPTARPPATA
jgi:uncharacterized protein involved in exopolysaccharide biosynthesis